MSLFGSLEIGKSGINASKSGQHTTGHNISNVDTPGYTRQQIKQSAFTSKKEGLVNGTLINGVRRLHDEYTNKKLVEESNLAEHWKTRADILKKVELQLLGPEGETLSSTLNDFWSSWENLSNAPEDLSVRTSVLRTGEKLASYSRQFHHAVNDIRIDISDEIERALKTVNSASKRIAELNKVIQNLEAIKGNPNDFRDERDQLVKDISRLIDIEWYENKKNHVEIQVGGGYSLVSGLKSYNMELYGKFKEGNMEGSGIRIGGQTLFDLSKSVKSGQIPELIQARDQDLKAYIDFFNEFSHSLSEEVNRIHAGATGLETKRRFDVSGKTFDETSRELPLEGVKTGNFEILLFDNKDNAYKTLKLNFEGGVTRVVDLVNQINEKAKETLQKADNESIDPLDFELPITAEINAEGRIEIKGSKRTQFAYGKDESGILASTGLQSLFFDGASAGSIRLNPHIEADPRQISAGYDGNPGDNRAALEIYELKDKLLMNDKTATLNQAYGNMIGDLGLNIKESEDKSLFHNNAKEQYQFLHDSVAGVNLDEELINMAKYQRAYDASAKYISAVDEMTQTLINM